ncbi:hypothetical protein HZS_2529 [Henneguya salminicola]|nr:hypothetical protein HZS_2529 [Henneguya salminicola]
MIEIPDFDEEFMFLVRHKGHTQDLRKVALVQKLMHKELNKDQPYLLKCFNCDRGCSARLIVRNNEISGNGEHNCEANRLASQLNLYPNQIFRDPLLTMRDQFANTPYSIPSKNQFYSAI